MTAVTVVKVVRKIMQPLHKKIMHFFFFIYFLRNFGKGSLTHLTADVMFSGQRFAILAMFVVYCTHLRFKNAQPKMCHSPKVEAKVNKKKFFFISWTLLSDNFY